MPDDAVTIVLKSAVVALVAGDYVEIEDGYGFSEVYYTPFGEARFHIHTGKGYSAADAVEEAISHF